MHQHGANPTGQKLSGLDIDMAKQVLNLVGMRVHGTIVVRQRLYQG
jgi:hypothetical protein